MSVDSDADQGTVISDDEEDDEENMHNGVQEIAQPETVCVQVSCEDVCDITESGNEASSDPWTQHSQEGVRVQVAPQSPQNESDDSDQELWGLLNADP